MTRVILPKAIEVVSVYGATDIIVEILGVPPPGGGGGPVAASDVLFDDTGLSLFSGADVQEAIETADGLIANAFSDQDALINGKEDAGVAASLLASHVSAPDPHTQYAPKASPTFTGTPLAPTAAAATSTTQIATTAFVQGAVNAIIAAADAMVFKGAIDCSTNPDYPAADRGWTYKVSVSGKIGGASGVNVESGDTLLCLTDGTPSGDQATVGAQWNITQANLDGAVIGPASSVDDYFAIFSGTSGKLLKAISPAAIAAALGLAPGGNTGEVQYNNGGAFAGAADVEIEGGQLRLPAIATPSAPAASGGKLFGLDHAGLILPAWLQDGMSASRILPMDWRKFGWYGSNSTTYGLDGAIAMSPTGTGTSKAWSAPNVYTRAISTESLVTTPATNAVAGYRSTTAIMTVGGAAAGEGGFYWKSIWGPATGVSVSTTRAFWGIRALTSGPSDVEPSGLVNIVGMGWDAADTNIQMMHNDGSGTATKIDLGASFPRPAVDRTELYSIELFSPPGTTQSVEYRVVRISTGAVATGTITTDLPLTGQILTFNTYLSVGGTSSVIGVALERIETYLFPETL